MAPLQRGIARYANGTSDVPYPASRFPASGLRSDLSNAVNLGGGMLAAPGDPQATIAAREQMYRQQGVQPQITPEYMRNPQGQAYANEMRAKGFTPTIGSVQRGAPAAPAVAAASEVPTAPIASPVSPEQIAQSLSMVQQPSASTPASAPVDFRHLLGNAIGMRGPEARAAAFGGGQPPGPSSLGSIGNLLTGQYGNVAADPNASAFSHYLAGAAEAKLNQQRVQSLTNGPSAVQKLVTGIFGTQGEWDALKTHDAAAETLSDPKVQQYLMHNPDQLAQAENDRLAYANQVPTPEFQQEMHKSLGALAEVQNNSKVPPDKHNEVANIMQNTGANSHQANASINPHAYTKEEFRKAFLGAPLNVVQALFPELSHIVSPEEALEKDYFGKLHGDYQDAVAELQRMGAVDQEAIANKKLPPYSQSSWFGKSKIAQQQDTVNKLQKIFMDQAAARIGVTGKPYPLPAKPD
jgi:hypothetical protein